MKLYLISQTTCKGYDTYDAAVVCAPNEEIARNTNPRNGMPMTADDWTYNYGSWCSNANEVNVTYLGKAATNLSQGLVLASFNAG